MEQANSSALAGTFSVGKQWASWDGCEPVLFWLVICRNVQWSPGTGLQPRRRRQRICGDASDAAGPVDGGNADGSSDGDGVAVAVAASGVGDSVATGIGHRIPMD